MLRAARSQWVGENDDHQVHFWHDGSTADSRPAMQKHTTPPDVFGNRTHDGIELADRNRLSILNVKMDVVNLTARVARRGRR